MARELLVRGGLEQLSQRSSHVHFFLRLLHHGHEQPGRAQPRRHWAEQADLQNCLEELHVGQMPKRLWHEADLYLYHEERQRRRQHVQHHDQHQHHHLQQIQHPFGVGTRGVREWNHGPGS